MRPDAQNIFSPELENQSWSDHVHLLPLILSENLSSFSSCPWSSRQRASYPRPPTRQWLYLQDSQVTQLSTRDISKTNPEPSSGTSLGHVATKRILHVGLRCWNGPLPPPASEHPAPIRCPLKSPLGLLMGPNPPLTHPNPQLAS